MSRNGKLMPNLDEKSTKLLYLTVLQRIDPFVVEILITAAHVTFYGFNIDTSQWSRKDMEDSLFVVKRNTQPLFQFIVMNRRSTELKKMFDTVQSIHDEMFYLHGREEEMQELNRSTTSKMFWFSFLLILVSLSVAGLQLWHLKSFFEKKKLI